jgi:hypothetical protein
MSGNWRSRSDKRLRPNLDESQLANPLVLPIAIPIENRLLMASQ